MEQAIIYGTPVNPPIWWIDPTNPEAHKINDGKFVKIYRLYSRFAPEQLFLFINVLDKFGKHARSDL